MTERICAIPDCSQVTGVPGTARGLCSGHYQRWRRYGSPLGEPVRVAKGCTCTAAGCGRPVRARGLCTTHYSRLRRHGTLTDARPCAAAPVGTKWCPTCRGHVDLEDFSRNRTKTDGLGGECKRCAADRRQRWRTAHPERAEEERRLHPEWFAAAQRRRRAADPEVGRRSVRARRARLAGVERETYSNAEIAERDGWCCQLCHEPIEPGRCYPDQLSLSIDHVIPLSRGGDDTRANVQASHLVCNLRKHTGERAA